MDKPVFKVVLTGHPWELVLYESEPGVLEVQLNDPEDPQSGAFITVPTEDFKRALEKLLSE